MLVLRIFIHSACSFYSSLSITFSFSFFRSFSLDFYFAICFLFHYIVQSSFPFCLFYSFSWLVFTYYNTRIATATVTTAHRHSSVVSNILRKRDGPIFCARVLFNKSYHKMIKCVVLHWKNNIKMRWNNQNKTGRCEVCWCQYSSIHMYRAI